MMETYHEEKDPLEAVFESPEESLAHHLNAMSKSMKLTFQKEFVRAKKLAALSAVEDAARLVKADDEEVDTKMTSVKKLLAALAEYDALKKG